MIIALSDKWGRVIYQLYGKLWKISDKNLKTEIIPYTFWKTE